MKRLPRKPEKRILWERDRLRFVVTYDSFNVEVRAKEGHTWKTDGYYCHLDQALKGLWTLAIQMDLLGGIDDMRRAYASATDAVKEVIQAFLPTELKEHHNINTPREDQILKAEEITENKSNGGGP